jgi:hypothetical protein
VVASRHFGGGLFDGRLTTLNGVCGVFVCVFLPTNSASCRVKGSRHGSSGRSALSLEGMDGLLRPLVEKLKC